MRPLREAVLKSSRRAAASAQQTDGVVGEHAVRAAAVGNDLDASRKGLDAGGELVDRDRIGARTVSRSELGKGPDVNDDHVTRDEPFRQLAAANLLEPVTVAEVRGG